MTFPTPRIGHSRHGLLFCKIDYQSNAKSSERDHDLPGIRTRDLWISSQHCYPLHHLGRQAGFQSGKSTTDQLFALRQILQKCNEFNITTHHLFIDFKAAYDTIIRNEVYVGMSELNKINTPYQSNAHYCDVLRQNTKRRLFRIL
jgi:hypothetical protein